MPSSLLHLKIRCIVNVLPCIMTTTYMLDSIHLLYILPMVSCLTYTWYLFYKEHPANRLLVVANLVWHCWYSLSNSVSKQTYRCTIPIIGILRGVLSRNASASFLCVPNILEGGLMHITVEDHIHIFVMKM